MQTPKSRSGSLEVPQKPSPATPRTARKLRTPGSDSDSVSPNPVMKTMKDRGAKVVDRSSPRSLATEKKRPNQVSELEQQIAQLQEELKKAKDQLISSESLKRRALQEAEEAKKQLAVMSEKLEETQKQLDELCESEEARVQELRKISQDRDRAWQSELEAVQKQHSMDASALAAAMNEIQKLKFQLDRVSESEASQARHAESAHADIHSLRLELTETLVLVERLKDQLNDSRESEARALEEVSRVLMLLEVMKKTEETLKKEHSDALESRNSLLMELEESKKKVNSLEQLLGDLQAKREVENGDCGEPELLNTEIDSLKDEVNQLRAALNAAERNYRDEYIKSTLEIRNAYELVEKAKSESCNREADLEVKLKEARAEVEDLKVKLIEKQNASHNENRGLEENKPGDRESELEIELKKSKSALEVLKASLLDQEKRLQGIEEENVMLKSEIMKRETEKNGEAVEAAIAAEREAMMKLGYLTEEAEKSCRKAERVTEQLDIAQAANSEMEAELRRLKVQSDQWRKAAEAAAAMLSNGDNGKCVERAGSLDYHTIGGKLSSLNAEDPDDDDSPKKKNGNMLKKIGVLLKKGQK